MSELQASGDLLVELERLLSHGAGTPIIVSRHTLRTALSRFLANEIDLADLTNWAGALELEDQARYEPGFEKLIASILFCLATPEINEPVNSDVARNLLRQLID